MNCFGFGTTFSPPLLLDLTNLPKQPMAGNTDLPRAQASDSTAPGNEADTTLAAANSGSYQASDRPPHRQSPDKTLTRGALPEEAIGLKLTHQGTPTAAATPPPEGVCRGVCPPGGLPGRAGAQAAAGSETTQGHPVEEQSSQQPACKEHAKSDVGKQGLAVVRLQAKAAKDALKSLGWLDQAYKAYSDPSTGLVCLPLTDSGGATLQGAGFKSDAELTFALGDTAVHSVLNGTSDAAVSMGSSRPVPNVIEGSVGRPKGSAAGRKGNKQKAGASQGPDMARLLALMQAGLAVVRPMEAQGSGRVQGGPAQRLKAAVTHLLQQVTPDSAVVSQHLFQAVNI